MKTTIKEEWERLETLEAQRRTFIEQNEYLRPRTLDLVVESFDEAIERSRSRIATKEE